MMQFVTWLSVIILGPGALAVFAWFLCEFVRSSRGDAASQECDSTDS